MTPPQLETIEEIFHAAMDCAPGQLNAFLDKSCDGDKVLRLKVEELLAAHRDAGDFIETPVVDLASSSIGNDHENDPLIGQTIGHYKILEQIGTGGMGEVYLATDTIAGRKAALKFLPARFTGDAASLKRFEQEARVVAGLNHPNVLTVYEIGEIHSTYYIASEFIDGETLRQHLSRGRMEVDEAVDVTIQVAGALAAAHSAGIVHRDVKPENIMLRPDGYVKVLDFGIAKLAEQELPETLPEDEALLMVETNLGSVLGTVRYMSPEQARGASVDKRTDIWSLGVVLYEMVTGRAPFNGDTPRDVMTSILAAEPPALANYMAQAAGALQQIVSKALQKDPAKRYHNANEMLDALKDLRRKLEFTAELERSAVTRLWLHWIRSPAALVLTLLAAALTLAFPFYWFRNPTRNSIPEKSIAVLPFENLSEQKEHAVFADGVQDDILTRLAKIADLKVISRTSVMEYRGKRNMRQIGNALRVSHVLEGSARRNGSRIRLNAQLIDTRTDTHVWAEQYDRDLNDLFAIQSEIAQRVAEQLHAKISAAEKVSIERKPTADLTAFDLYSRANDILLAKTNVKIADFVQAVDLLNQAVARDPSFLDAYCQLAFAHDALYFNEFDHTPARLAMAEAAIRNAFRLRPDAGEAHLARAEHFYRGYRDYDAALAELEIARQTLPNHARIFQLMGYIQRRQGRWEESRRNLERAAELDPRDVGTLQLLAEDYEAFRRHDEAKSWLARAIAVEPNDAWMKLMLPRWEMQLNADTRPLHQAIESIRATNPAAISSHVAGYWLVCALAERDAAAATDALGALHDSEIFLGVQIQFNRPFVEGLIARMTNDEHKAQLAFTAARAEQEKIVQAQPDFGPAWCVLGLIDAGLGRKEEALREGRRAIELLPMEKDARVGNYLVSYFAVIAAWVGEKDLACEQLAIVIRPPSFVSYGGLKLLPFWDPLRGEPCFEKIVASLAPKPKQ